MSISYPDQQETEKKWSYFSLTRASDAEWKVKTTWNCRNVQSTLAGALAAYNDRLTKFTANVAHIDGANTIPLKYKLIYDNTKSLTLLNRQVFKGKSEHVATYATSHTYLPIYTIFQFDSFHSMQLGNVLSQTHKAYLLTSSG